MYYKLFAYVRDEAIQGDEHRTQEPVHAPRVCTWLFPFVSRPRETALEAMRRKRSELVASGVRPYAAVCVDGSLRNLVT
jgi:hypothetical protein